MSQAGFISSVSSLIGTQNEVLVNGTYGQAITGIPITLTTPQPIGTTSTPTFATVTANSMTVFDVPVNPTDVANKHYVDLVSSGFFFKASCYSATTVNLSATYLNGAAGVGATLTNSGTLAVFSSDGVTPPLNSRILIKNQNSTLQNGIYILNPVGSASVAWVMTRSSDYNTPALIHVGDLIPIDNGTSNGNTVWLETSVVVTIGTDPITFSLFSNNPSSIANDFVTDSGTAVPSARTLNILGTSNQLRFTGSGNTVTGLLIGPYTPATYTAHGVLLGEGTSSIVATSAGTSGQLLQSSGASADPAWTTATYPGITTINRILYSSANNTVSEISAANNGVLITSAGGVPSISSTLPSAVQLNITSLGTISTGVWNGTVITVPFGGTGVATLTSGQLVVGAGTSPVTSIAYSSTPSTSNIVSRDSSGNSITNNFVSVETAVTSAAGTTVLTAASSRIQQLTGTTTQTFQLPNATTLSLGHTFEFENNSTGILTVVDSASTGICTIPAGGYAEVIAISIGSSAGSWDKHFLMPSNSNYGTAGMTVTGTLTATSTLSNTGNVGIGNAVSSTSNIGQNNNTTINMGTIVGSGGAGPLIQSTINIGGSAGNVLDGRSTTTIAGKVYIGSLNQPTDVLSTVFMPGVQIGVTIGIDTLLAVNGSNSNSVYGVTNPHLSSLYVGTQSAGNALYFVNATSADMNILLPAGILTITTGIGALAVSAGAALALTGGAAATLTAGAELVLTSAIRVDLNVDTANNAVNVGTGNGNKTVIVGSTTGSSTTTINAGSGNITLGTRTLVIGHLSSSTFLTPGYATTVTAAGTTTLTSSSAQQQYFTGTSTQTVPLPVVSTMILGQFFRIVNLSSGNLTVNSSDGSLVKTMAANTVGIMTVVSTSGTGASSWDVQYEGAGSGISSILGTANQISPTGSSTVTLSLTNGISIGSYQATSPPSGGMIVPGIVGIGTNAPSSNATLHIDGSGAYGIYSTGSRTSVDISSNQSSITTEASFAPTLGSSISTAVSIRNNYQIPTAQSTSVASGIFISPTFLSHAGAISNYYGVYFAGGPDITGGGTIGYAYGGYFSRPQLSTLNGNAALYADNINLGWAGQDTPTNSLIVNGQAGFGTAVPSSSARVSISNSYAWGLFITGTTTANQAGIQAAIELNQVFNPTGGNANSGGIYNSCFFAAPSAQTITSAFGMYVSNQYTGNVGTITDAYGIWIDVDANAAGTITRSRGLKVAKPTLGSTNYCATFDIGVGIGADNAVSTSNPALAITSTSARNTTFSGTQTTQTSNLQTGILVNTVFNPAASVSSYSAAVASFPNFNASNTTTMANAICFYASPTAASNAGAITNMYGFYYDGGGTLTNTLSNHYGLRVAVPAFGANKYTAHFDVGVGIGAANLSSATNALLVTGAMGCTTALNACSASGIATIGSSTAATISAAGLLNIANTTDTSSGSTGSINTLGGLGVTKKIWCETGLTVNSGGITSNAGNNSFTANAASTSAAMIIATSNSIGLEFNGTQTALVGGTDQYSIRIVPTFAPGTSISNIQVIRAVPTWNPTGGTTSIASNYYSFPLIGGTGTISQAYGCYLQGGSGSGPTVNTMTNLRVETPGFGSTKYTAYFDNTVCVGGLSTTYALYVSTDSAGKPGVGGLWTVVSDERVKTDIADCDDALCVLEKLKVREFKFTEDYCEVSGLCPIRKNYGFIAQEYEEVFPDDVTTSTEKFADLEIEDCKSINTGQTSALLVRAVQQLNDKIRQMQNQIDQLLGV